MGDGKKASYMGRSTSALDYLLHHPLPPVDRAKFERESGVGVVITPDQIEAAVEEVIGKYKKELQEKRYKFNMGTLMGKVIFP
uniref:Glutaminyl-tRNA synthetase n=1 Tax=Magallana gigas TaxID=29159 RepID=K1PFQ6_MAGGI